MSADNQCNLCCPGCGQGDEIDIGATVWVALVPRRHRRDHGTQRRPRMGRRLTRVLQRL